MVTTYKLLFINHAFIFFNLPFPFIPNIWLQISGPPSLICLFSLSEESELLFSSYAGFRETMQWHLRRIPDTFFSPSGHAVFTCPWQGGEEASGRLHCMFLCVISQNHAPLRSHGPKKPSDFCVT